MGPELSAGAGEDLPNREVPVWAPAAGGTPSPANLSPCGPVQGLSPEQQSHDSLAAGMLPPRA